MRNAAVLLRHPVARELLQAGESAEVAHAVKVDPAVQMVVFMLRTASS